ncbi:hypothetical protein B296_00052134 [Ensete ventricosum]|uniref:Uncharacterized protein n=1 Tax=Ensete ventricosum TaxID=4639 RepID=A0A426XUN1_ENSVE|nr:hypothetical protein B296_00052134 [Ensete ventricosum]
MVKPEHMKMVEPLPATSRWTCIFKQTPDQITPPWLFGWSALLFFMREAQSPDRLQHGEVGFFGCASSLPLPSVAPFEMAGSRTKRIVFLLCILLLTLVLSRYLLHML